jgi:two-component system, NarL family, nitrate/nitrite response regulator NarL
MGLSTLHQKQLLPIQQVPLQQIPTILICKNSLVRAGIRHILDGTRYVVAEDLEGSSKPLASPDASPSLYIFDESHSADALAEMIADLTAQCPSARVVVLADHLDPTTTMRALHAGVNGLCSTSMDRAALLKALELVMLGETFIASALALTILDEASQAHQSGPSMTSSLTPTNDATTRAHNLTSREVEILKRLMEGESNKVIARKLDIAEATIKVHVKSILRKVRVKNRTQAALWATAHLSAPSSAGEGGC